MQVSPQVQFGQVLVITGKANNRILASSYPAQEEAFDEAIIEKLPRAAVVRIPTEPAKDGFKRIVIDGEADTKEFLFKTFIQHRKLMWDSFAGASDNHPANINRPLGAKLPREHGYYGLMQDVAMAMVQEAEAAGTLKRLDISDAKWQQVRPE